MNLTNDEIIDLMDCVNYRIDDLTDCAMFGDGLAVEGEIERLDSLVNKLSETLETENGS